MGVRMKSRTIGGAVALWCWSLLLCQLAVGATESPCHWRSLDTLSTSVLALNGYATLQVEFQNTVDGDDCYCDFDLTAKNDSTSTEDAKLFLNGASVATISPGDDEVIQGRNTCPSNFSSSICIGQSCSTTLANHCLDDCP